MYGQFRDIAKEKGYRKASRNAVRYLIGNLYQPPLIYLHSRFADRWNVFNEEWDLLIILDTCRPDALQQVSDEYSFINEVDTRWSVGASSPEWVYNTFDEKYREEINKTAYVSSNPFSWAILENNFETNHEGENGANLDVMYEGIPFNHLFPQMNFTNASVCGTLPTNLVPSNSPLLGPSQIA